MALVPPRTNGTEQIDTPGVPEAEIVGNLADLARINRWLGGLRLTTRALDRLTADLAPGASLTLLDVATGGADIPRALVRWAALRGLHAQVVATDLSPQIVRIAAAVHGSALGYAAADGCWLPFADGSVDVALCSFALHHLEPAQAVLMLREMARVARRGLVVNDLLRWQPTYWATRLATGLLSRNPLTRHDGPLSVLRAYTPAELCALVAAANLRISASETFLVYRIALTVVRDASHDT